jgi:hypothetical protein
MNFAFHTNYYLQFYLLFNSIFFFLPNSREGPSIWFASGRICTYVRKETAVEEVFKELVRGLWGPSQEFPGLTELNAELDVWADSDAGEVDAQPALFTPCTCTTRNWSWTRTTRSSSSWPPAWTTSDTSNSTRNEGRVSL